MSELVTDKAPVRHTGLMLQILPQKMLRRRIRKKTGTDQFTLTNANVLRICNRENVSEHIKVQQKSFLGHIARYSPTSIVKQLLYNADNYKKSGTCSKTLEQQVLQSCNIGSFSFHREANKEKSTRSLRGNAVLSGRNATGGMQR